MLGADHVPRTIERQRKARRCCQFSGVAGVEERQRKRRLGSVAEKDAAVAFDRGKRDLPGEYWNLRGRGDVEILRLQLDLGPFAVGDVARHAWEDGRCPNI